MRHGEDADVWQRRRPLTEALKSHFWHHVDTVSDSHAVMLHHTVSSHPLMVFIMPCFTLYFVHPVTLPVVKDEYLTERFRTPGLWKRGIEKQQFLNATGLGGHLRHIKSWYSEKKETFLQEFLLLPSFAADAVNKITRALWHALPPVEL